MKNLAWIIAGLDSSGGAGLQADILTFHHLNVYAASMMTASTAQNSYEITSIHTITPDHLKAQINSLQKIALPQAIKIGMLGYPAIIQALKNTLPRVDNIVLDPVFMASSGKKLWVGQFKDYLHHLHELFPYLTLLTPNLVEAEMILNRNIHCHDDMESAAQELVSRGIKNVVIKGGHLQQQDYSQDYWTNGQDSFWLSCPRYVKKNYRGSGCVFSSAIAACLALGYHIKDALVIAKMYVNRGIRLAHHDQTAVSIMHHASWPHEAYDLPFLTKTSELHLTGQQKKKENLGLYPIVDSSDWIKKLLPLGINIIQLRIKNKRGLALENEIKRSIKLARQYQVKLFINDYWDLALANGAYGVHLGQEDLYSANIQTIQQAGLKLGISTHCYYEVAHAKSYQPDYIAIGPIYSTTSKPMSFLPQGITQLQYWRKVLAHDTLIAIGGINKENIAEVAQTGVDGIAMISAITQEKDSEQIITTLKSLIK